MKYDLSIIGTAGLPARYGGFETLAEALTLCLSAEYRIQIFCSGTAVRPDNRPHSYLGASLSYVDLSAHGWQSVPYDFLSLWRSARSSKTVLVLGVSGCLILPLIRLLYPKLRVVTNVDGIEWRRRKWGRLAKLTLRVSENVGVRFSNTVIADNQGIADYIRERYCRDPELIAYGGDNATQESTQDPAAAGDTPFGKGAYFLSICRIEPENNIAEMLEAFRLVSDANLVAVGNWQASDYGRQLWEIYSKDHNIRLLDPVYAKDRLHALRRSAKAYVHGHSAGGTNPSLVEAMYSSMPVLAYDVNYNRHTTDNKAEYWRSVAELAKLLQRVGDDELTKNGTAMRSIALRRYTWAQVSSQYQAVLFPREHVPNPSLERAHW